ncbi:hypothetical protein [Bartonella bovis]|nr:hypothetical protein [Bartonella bovis]
MVMRCVFKHHVYLCVVSTALMAGLSLITSHTSKAYADQNCGSGSVVGTVNNEPIVCDGGVTRILNSRSGGKDININMDKHSGKAAVTVKDGANITILKKLKVTGSKGGGLPVIKVERGGALTLNEDVDVEGATGMQKAIVVDESGSSVTLNGVLKGFERVQVKNGGMVVLGEKVTGIEKVKVKINDGGTVTLNGNVTFNNDEAGIKIEGSGGTANVIGVGRTMTVNGSGSGSDGVGIQMDGAGGTASVVGLNIKNNGGTGTGVDVQSGTGTMTLMGVEISEFRVGVNANKGTVKLMGSRRLRLRMGGRGCGWGNGEC